MGGVALVPAYFGSSGILNMLLPFLPRHCLFLATTHMVLQGLSFENPWMGLVQHFDDSMITSCSTIASQACNSWFTWISFDLFHLDALCDVCSV